MNRKTLLKETLRIKSLIDEYREIGYQQFNYLSKDKVDDLMNIKPTVIIRGNKLNMTTQ